MVGLIPSRSVIGLNHASKIDSYLVSAILQVPIIKTSKNENLQSEMELTFL